MEATDYTIATTLLQEGDAVYTTKADGEDFQLPLVSPTRGKIRGVVRTVRSVRREQGGRVVRFTDGSKSRPINGHTGWLSALGA